MSQFYTVQDNMLQVRIKVIPNSSKTAISGIENDHLKIKIAALPVDGKANAALRQFLSKQLGCAKNDIDIKSGAKSRCKTVILPLEYKDKLNTL